MDEHRFISLAWMEVRDRSDRRSSKTHRRRVHSPWLQSLALAAIIGLSIPLAMAEVFCVSSAMELQSALWQAESNGEHDEIRIKPGHYSTEDNGSLGLGFIYAATEARHLTMTGGWNDECSGTRGTQNAFATVLDGGGANQVLLIAAGDGNVIVTVANLTVQSGNPNSDQLPAGGLHVKGFGEDHHAGLVVIDRVAFVGNESAAGASALLVASKGRVEIANSLFHDNSTDFAFTAVVDRDDNGSGATYFINNTVVNNVANHVDNIAGVQLFNPNGSGNVAANNVFWNNGAYDLFMSGPGGSISNNHLLHNILQNALGFGGANIGNSTDDPQLDSDFSLLQGSPGIDTGYTPPGTANPPVELDWVLRDFDLVRVRRELGPGVDIGAFEFSRLFSDRFESD